MESRELSKIGEVAQESLGVLEELLPEDATVRAAMIVVELTYDCDNCGETHEFCFTHSNVESTAYRRGLLYEALDSLECAHSHESEPDPHDED